jgi:hypothetical protein
MNVHTVTQGDYVFRIETELNTRGSWVVRTQVFRGERPLFPELIPDAVCPEWLSEPDAIREAVEQGYRMARHAEGSATDPAAGTSAAPLHAGDTQ